MSQPASSTPTPTPAAAAASTAATGPRALPVLSNRASGGKLSTYQSLDALSGAGGAAMRQMNVEAGKAAVVASVGGVPASASSSAASSGSATPVLASASSSSSSSLPSAVEQAVVGVTHDLDLFGLTVKIVSASNLSIGDTFTRSSDPYVKVTVDDLERKSKYLKKTLNPVWNETFTFVFATKPKFLKIEVFDHDEIGKHDPLGYTTMNLDKLGIANSTLTYDGDVRLEGPTAGKGSIKIFIESLPIPNSVGRTSTELNGIHQIEDIVSLIELKIVGAENLGGANASKLKARNDPFCHVNYGLHTFKTAMIPHSNNPIWNQLCPLWITRTDNNTAALIKISVYDYERVGKNVLLGNVYLQPSRLKSGHFYDIKLPLTLEDTQTDAQLSVLMQDLAVHHKQESAGGEDALVVEQKEDMVDENGEMKESTHEATSHPSASASAHGTLHLHFQIKPREQVESEFYSHLLEDYDQDQNGGMELTEMIHALTTIGVKLTEQEIEAAFDEVDTKKTGSLGVEELAKLFRTEIFTKKAVLRQLYSIILYGCDAFDSLIMKGCLSGSNTNALPDMDPTVDNSGVIILVQDRESGMVVRENIPAYIKSALVLLNRTWVGKLASSKIRGTIRTLTIRQGKKMDQPKSKKDIPNFIKVHRLNMGDVEKDLSEYNTFNEFFYRRLKPNARSCYMKDDNTYAVSPADCRLMVFRSLEESTRLWIKGKNFTLGNLFGGYDPTGSIAAKFNGGQLAIARLAPQDYHRFHFPVSGKLQKRFMIQGDYNTVSPIAVRNDIDVYTDNKRCICPIETQEFGLVLLIAIAATMVGSIRFPGEEDLDPMNSTIVGKEVHKFDEAGYFAFGGSTTLILFQPSAINFDADLLKNSDAQLETLVKVGSSLGKATGKYTKQ